MVVKIYRKIGFVLFLGLSIVSASLSFAAFRAHHIEERLAHWAAVGYPPDERELQSLLDANQRSLSMFSMNPRHAGNRASLLEWKSYLQRLYPEHARKSSREALGLYKSLVELAPSLGYAWAGIAELRAGEGAFDDETTTALERAVKLNPVEDLTQRRIIRMGIKYWNHWPNDSRRLVKSTIERALNTDVTLQPYPISDLVFDTAADYHWEENLGPLLSDQRIKNRFESRKRFRAAHPRPN